MGLQPIGVAVAGLGFGRRCTCQLFMPIPICGPWRCGIPVKTGWMPPALFMACRGTTAGMRCWRSSGGGRDHRHAARAAL
ncbi:MAG: hypothetical protein CM15mP77_1630 [Synechococcus sp.]|nr:MAG: hypothetical protein CM15mP77_1630 [Synechococcus sp.]